MTQNIAYKTNREIFALFNYFIINYSALTSAFNHINCQWLFLTIRNRLSKAEKQNKIVNILKNLYRRTNAELKDDPKLNFYATSGVRQGGPVSPLLLNFL